MKMVSKKITAMIIVAITAFCAFIGVMFLSSAKIAKADTTIHEIGREDNLKGKCFLFSFDAYTGMVFYHRDEPGIDYFSFVAGANNGVNELLIWTFYKHQTVGNEQSVATVVSGVNRKFITLNGDEKEVVWFDDTFIVHEEETNTDRTFNAEDLIFDSGRGYDYVLIEEVETPDTPEIEPEDPDTSTGSESTETENIEYTVDIPIFDSSAWKESDTDKTTNASGKYVRVYDGYFLALNLGAYSALFTYNNTILEVSDAKIHVPTYTGFGYVDIYIPKSTDTFLNAETGDVVASPISQSSYTLIYNDGANIKFLTPSDNEGSQESISHTLKLKNSIVFPANYTERILSANENVSGKFVRVYDGSNFDFKIEGCSGNSNGVIFDEKWVLTLCVGNITYNLTMPLLRGENYSDLYIPSSSDEFVVSRTSADFENPLKDDSFPLNVISGSVTILTVDGELPDDGETPSDGPSDENNTGNQPSDDNKPNVDLDGVGDWVDEKADSIADWLNSTTGIAVSGSTVIVVVVVVIVISVFSKKRR